jgi:hypothetical protein
MTYSSFLCCLKAVLTDAPDFDYFNSVVPHTFWLSGEAWKSLVSEGCMDAIFVSPTRRVFFQLWATIVSAFPRNYAVLWKVQQCFWLNTIMHFLQKVQLCYSCLIERRDLKDLGWHKGLKYVCMWRWMAVLKEDIHHGIYSPKGGLHQCCVSTQKIQVPRVGSGSGYSETYPNLAQTPELDKNLNCKYLFLN